MPVFPKLIYPYEDELLYSYLRRLANEYYELSWYQFLNEWFRGTLNKLKHSGQLNRYDTAFDISSMLTDLLNIDSNDQYLSLIETYLSHSVYSFCAPLWAEYQKADWVLNQFRSMRDSTLVPHIHTDQVGRLRYCPECMKEEGERFYHLSHNLPGVTACWKHKVRLLEYSGKAGGEMTEELLTETEPCSKWEARYAEFAWELSRAKITGNLNTTARAVRDKLNELNLLTAEELKDYMDRFTGTDTDISIAETAVTLRKEAGEFQKRSVPEKTAAALASLFKDTEELKSYIHYDSPKEEFMEMIQKRGYEMISAYHPYLVILQHSNCQPFVTSPELIIDGWGCPDCEDRLTPQELFRQVFEIQKGDEYELLSDFEKYKTPVTVRHNECGKVYTQMPVKLIKRDIPCKCHLDVNNIDRAKKWLAGHYPQFEILSFTDMKEEVTLFCNDCMSTSTYPDFYYFMDHPRCRHCQKVTYDQDRINQTIRDLVGNEYTLVTPFTYMHDESAVFRHNTCGHEFRCAPVRFIRGIRCSKCRTKMRVDELNTYLKSSTQNIYEIIGTGENTPDLCTVRNNLTGEIQKLNKAMILQELKRPTPSIILDIEKDTAVSAHTEVSEKLQEFMKPHPAFLKSALREYCRGIEEDEFNGIFTDLILQKKVREIHRNLGIYTSPDCGMDLEEIIEKTLLLDEEGHRIGYWTGSSFLHDLGLSDSATTLTLVSEKCAGKYKAHTVMLGRRVTITGPQYGDITDDNWKAMCLLSWSISSAYSAELTEKVLPFMTDLRVDDELMHVFEQKIHRNFLGRFRNMMERLKEYKK